MQMSPRSCLSLGAVAISLLLGGCGSQSEPEKSAEIPNPASEYCVKKGGKVEMVKDDAGEKGMCHLPDGTVVEEWELFRRDNPQS